MGEDLVTIATFGTVHEAEMARGYLEANEVDVFLADEEMFRITGHRIGWIKLQVRPEDADTARALLSQVESDPGVE